MLPVKLSVPSPLKVGPPFTAVMFPTIFTTDETDGEIVNELLFTFAVRVKPLALRVKPPPAVTPVVARLSILNTVGDTSIVTVKVFEYTSSALVGSAPVFQTVVSDQLPDLTARTMAITQSPFASMNA